MLFTIALMRFRIRTGDSMALLYLSSTTWNTGHTTSWETWPEKSNQDSDPRMHVEGIQAGEDYGRIWQLSAPTRRVITVLDEE